jgi:hypothetical protein
MQSPIAAFSPVSPCPDDPLNLSAAVCPAPSDGPMTRIGARSSRPIGSMVTAKKETAAANRGGASPRSPKRPRVRSEIFLREEDLDAPVLRLAYAIRRRHTEIVLTATDDGHVAARHAECCQSIGHGVCPPLRKPLIVAG